ncbi:MAG: DMT family transporter [Cyanobacteria bacterium P01_H01_bin.15]
MSRVRERTVLGSALSLVGGVLMGGVGIAGRLGAQAGLTPFQMLAAQVALLVPVSAALIYVRSGVRGFKPRKPWSLVIRTVSGFFYFSTFYWALRGLPVADVLVLESTNTFFAMLIAWFFLGHRVSRIAIWLSIIAFIGVCLILVQHGAHDVLNPYSLIALLAGVGRAAGSVATGVAGKTEPAERIMFYYALGMLLFSMLGLPGQWSPIEGRDWLILVAPAILFIPQNLVYTVANRLIPAYMVGALFYSSILVGVIADQYLFRTELSGRGIVGMLLTVAAGLALSWIRSREQSVAKQHD